MAEIIVQAKTEQLTISNGETVFIFDNLAENKVAKLKVDIGQDCRVKYLFLSAGESLVEAERDITIGPRTVFESYQAYLGTTNRLMNFHNHINEQVNINQRAIFFLKDKQSLRVNDIHTFLQPKSSGTFRAEGLLDDAAQIEYYSQVNIKPEAQLTDCRIDLKLNLLGKEARGLMQPSLFIAANQVQAGHGASTFNLDQDQLFYFNARGVTEIQAKMLAVKAASDRFIKAIDHKLGQKTIRDIIDNIL